MSNWISVNEGVPEFDDCYIDKTSFQPRYFQLAIGGWSHTTCGYYDPLCGLWCWLDRDGKSFVYDSAEEFVIAWSPLSEPDDYVDKLQEEFKREV